MTVPALADPRHEFGPTAIALHWLVAGLAVAALATGFGAANGSEAAVGLLRMHAILGALAGTLSVVRLVQWLMRLRSPNRHEARSIAVRAVHLALVVIPVGMLASGIGMMVLSGAGAILFGGAPAPLPDFGVYPPRTAHGAGAYALAALAGLHAAAALYHHVWRRDNTLRAMWFR